MNKYIPIAVLAVIALAKIGFSESPLPSPSVLPSVSPSPSPVPNCLYQSASPEMHTLYGSKEVILKKLGDWSEKPSEHRVFIQITQGHKSGSVKFFEKTPGSNDYTVTEWEPHETAELVAALDRTIMANKGVNCVGEQMKAVLKKLGKGKTTHDVAEPASASAAFSHSVKEASGEFLKTVIIFGC